MPEITLKIRVELEEAIDMEVTEAAVTNLLRQFGFTNITSTVEVIEEEESDE